MPISTIALVVGAGFSCEAGLPSTKNIVKSFLKSQQSNLGQVIENEITDQLDKFWKYVFNFNKRSLPSLEDHFTVLDLAANSGRNVGPEYTPRKLRAIRRFSIQRIFQILESNYDHSEAINELFSSLAPSQLSLVSTNWDIVVENHLTHLQRPYWYGLQVEDPDGNELVSGGIPLLKLHGSTNWIYCDCCRRLYAGRSSDGKVALHSHIYITRDDFKQLCPNNYDVAHRVAALSRTLKKCVHCDNRLGARIGTFSYRKEISIPQFQTIWQQAFSALRDSATWLFVGYSLPEADFEFRHLLKSAEKAARHQKKIEVVLKGDRQAATRFRRFFGITTAQIYQRGLSDYVENHLSHLPNSNGQV